MRVRLPHRAMTAHKPASDPPAHLTSAARALQRLLRQTFPEFAWVVTVRDDAAPGARDSSPAPEKETEG